MMYLLPLIVGIVFSQYGVVFDDGLRRFLVEMALAVLLFFDSLKLRFSVVTRYNNAAVSTAFFACLFYLLMYYFTLPSEAGIALLPLLIIVSYDVRASAPHMSSTLIPAYIRQFLSLDGVIRSLLVAICCVFVMQHDPWQVLFSVSIGVVSAAFAMLLIFLTRRRELLATVPVLTFFLSTYFFGEGIVATCVAGLLVGNLYRFSASGILSFYRRYYPLFLGVVLGFFGNTFGLLFLHTFSWKILLTTLCFALLINAFVISITFLFVRMQISTFVFCALSNVPGVTAFLLCIWMFEPNQGFIPWMLLCSFVIHQLFVTRLVEWYGKLFTGRDLCSKFEEHKPTVELPV